MQKWCIFLTNIHLNIYLYINVFLRCATVICTRTGSMPFTNKFKYFFVSIYLGTFVNFFFGEHCSQYMCHRSHRTHCKLRIEKLFTHANELQFIFGTSICIDTRNLTHCWQNLFYGMLHHSRIFFFTFV